MRKHAFGALVALGLGISGVGAHPLLQHFYGHPHGGGGGGGGGGTAYAFDAASGVRADHVNGQTVVSWPDTLNAGIDDDTYRYRVYRSTSPITALNYTSATEISSYILNNSAQLIGGIPDGNGTGFEQANRQANNTSNPMMLLPDAQLGGTRTVAYGTGQRVYTALATGTAYYAVVRTLTDDTSPTFIGSVGPIAETQATAEATLYLHRTTAYGAITGSTSGLPIVMVLHGSKPDGGAPTGSQSGDVWEWFGDANEGWQVGRPSTFSVLKDGPTGTVNYPSLTSLGGTLVYGNRGDIWSPNGEHYLQLGHFGFGVNIGGVNKFIPGKMKEIEHQVSWIGHHYGGDLNQVHCTGISYGAIACTDVGSHMDAPHLASVWLGHPIFDRRDLGTNLLCGGTWSANEPFAPTLGTAPKVCGTDFSAITMSDGSKWQDFVDLPTYWASNPAQDMPFIAGMDTKNDANSTFAHMTLGFNALESAHRAWAFVFYMGVHYTGSTAMGLINCDWNGAIIGLCYNKSQFAVNKPLPAFSHDTADDNPGTGTPDPVTGIMDGDPVGGFNIGFIWNITETTSGVSLTVGNNWMHRNPTTFPATTMVDSIPASGTGTFHVTDASVFLPIDANNGVNYEFLINNQEIVTATVNVSNNTITIAARHQLGTSSPTTAYAVGVPIMQYPTQPTGPMHGPFNSITTDVTLRRLQQWHPADGSHPCTVTPDGESPTTPNITVTNGLPVLTGVKINWTGSTSIVCG